MPLTNGDVLRYNGTNWTNIQNSVANLVDATITSPTNGQVLSYNTGTSKWINQTQSGGYTSGTLALNATGATDLISDNEVINCPCDEFGRPDYISVNGNNIIVKPIKVSAQGQVFTTTQSTVNIVTAFGNATQGIYYVYADYNSGTPVIGLSLVEPDSSFRSALSAGSYLSLDGTYEDPFNNIWMPNGTTAVLSTVRSKFGTSSYLTNQSLENLMATRVSTENTRMQPIPKHFPMFMFDFFFYVPATPSIGTLYTIYNNGSFGMLFNFASASTVLSLSLSSNGTTWNIANATSCGNVVVGQWNYLSLSYNGTNYVANLNGTNTTVPSTLYIVFSPNHRFRDAGTNLFNISDYVFTPFIRPSRNSAVAAFDISTLGITGNTFASCLNYNAGALNPNGYTGISDQYGFPWYSRDAVVPGTNNVTGIQSIQLGGTQFLYTSFFPQLGLLTEWTLEFFFRTTTTTQDESLMDCRFGTGSPGFEIYTSTTNVNISLFANAAAVFSASVIGAYAVNTWVHVAVTFSSSSGYRVYLNGNQALTSSTTDNVSVNQCLLGRFIEGNTVTRPLTDFANFRISPFLVYTANFTTPTTPLLVNSSRDLFTPGNNTMTRQGLNPGVAKRLYIGSVRRIGSVISHYASTQNVIPAITNGVMKIMRDGFVVAPSKTYSVLSSNQRPYLSNFILRDDGTVLVGGNLELPNYVNTTSFSEYHVIPNLPKIKRIASTQRSAFFVDFSGNVYVLGTNTAGVFGNGTALNAVINTPTIVYSGTDPTVITSSNVIITNQTQTCAFIVDNGSIFAAGTNDVGQLGIGSVSANQLTFTVVPQQGGNPWKSVYSNGRSTFFITSDGSNNQLYASGINTIGQLGIGTIISVSSPTACRYNDNSLVSNVKRVVNTLQATTPTTNNSYMILNNGNVYISGTGSNQGTRSNFVTLPSRGWNGPIAYDMRDILTLGNDPTICVMLLRQDYKLFVMSGTPNGRIFGTSHGTNIMAGRILRNFPIVFVDKIEGDQLSPYSNGLAVTRDGKLLSSGTWNNEVSTGGPSYSSNYPTTNEGHIGWELSFPFAVKNTVSLFSAFNAAAPVDVRYGVFVILANGEVYGSGSDVYTTLSTRNNFIKMNLP